MDIQASIDELTAAVNTRNLQMEQRVTRNETRLNIHDVALANNEKCHHNMKKSLNMIQTKRMIGFWPLVATVVVAILSICGVLLKAIGAF